MPEDLPGKSLTISDCGFFDFTDRNLQAVTEAFTEEPFDAEKQMGVVALAHELLAGSRSATAEEHEIFEQAMRETSSDTPLFPWMR